MPLSWNEIHHNAIRFTGRAVLPHRPGSPVCAVGADEKMGRRGNAARRDKDRAPLTGMCRRQLQEFHDRISALNFPEPACGWLKPVSEKQRVTLAAAVQKVRSVRAEFLAPGARLCEPQHAATSSSARKSRRLSGSEAAAGHRPALLSKTATLAELYDPLATPPAVQKAQEELDRAVDKCYRPDPYTSERQRVEFLFPLYEKLTAPLVAAANAKPKRTRKV